MDFIYSIFMYQITWAIDHNLTYLITMFRDINDDHQFFDKLTSDLEELLTIDIVQIELGSL